MALGIGIIAAGAVLTYQGIDATHVGLAVAGIALCLVGGWPLGKAVQARKQAGRADPA